MTKKESTNIADRITNTNDDYIYDVEDLQKAVDSGWLKKKKRGANISYNVKCGSIRIDDRSGAENN